MASLSETATRKTIDTGSRYCCWGSGLVLLRVHTWVVYFPLILTQDRRIASALRL